MKNIVILTGSSHPKLAQRISDSLGIELGSCKLGKFSNQETSVEIKDSVREKHVYIIQSGCGQVNDNIIELLILVQACRMGSSKRITVVTPLFPYSRQSERSQRKRQPQHEIGSEIMNSLLQTNSSRPLPQGEFAQSFMGMSEGGYRQWCARGGTLVANLLQAAGADHLIAMDLHDPQYQGFFQIPVDLVYAEPSIIQWIRSEIPNWRQAVVVSPDAGGAKRATSICNRLNLDFALIHKEDVGSTRESMGLVGEVEGRPAIILDDMIDSGSTIGLASEVLKRHGAKEIYAIAVHGVFSGPALEIINKSPLTAVACTNSVPQEDFRAQCSKLRTIDVAPMLGEIIRRTFYGESVTQLFVHDEQL
ncbi:ribose-phosphate pyrophosphokinase [Coemansia sp. RSA 989]|nr:phosphoribosyltransferase-like protein [Coemansia mojavensis]KAJ1741690.1 ribose-phosphate pyrophosphokinase [Coemansia sp. RSA 1086]KAJ1753032.1 ribose-phosphate pyrophosphokinase [Coemansia sp. RSA 1821]KAJ1868052.1 ribose-phosphate pyrophosphokinase [Coemansia sp. RSA 989]KAJ1875404.1 ribose-phosphate pyrophosphokinase [Coemansia sp. RSA 990]KAJ2633882.1 ribose-phosphate pyrophosphokinase [Coemansia sp. RSA 1290]KAJ2651535.1 ribose-phosphate pyrophosphokinase [Coemansia sp. RSA 1250]KA